jgi:hypothetical protein
MRFIRRFSSTEVKQALRKIEKTDQVQLEYIFGKIVVWWLSTYIKFEELDGPMGSALRRAIAEAKQRSQRP